MRSLSVRAKLTLWYLAVISTALVLFGLLAFGALRFALLKLKQSALNRREQRLVLFLEQNRQKHIPAPLSEQLDNYALIAHEGNLLQIRDLRGDLIFPLDLAAAAWLSHLRQNVPNRSSGI
jgi:two-component system heavy metal sensor histidine kinase CusS